MLTKYQSITIVGLVLTTVVFVLSGCAVDATKQLERVAKDWSLTIRASQVIPVYPLSEDIQPGDVFLVPVSISKQTEIYRQKGFLPTNQLFTRLDLSTHYASFYKDSYWKGSFNETPHDRPILDAEDVLTPHSAFPSYTFTVDRSQGIHLALPIQGIPIGLGLMGGARATGTVTINSSYTYGIDSLRVYKALSDWVKSDDTIQLMLSKMVNSSESEIFLRVVTRVYLAKELDVTLANTESLSGGADLGQDQGPSPPAPPSVSQVNNDALSEGADTGKDQGTSPPAPPSVSRVNNNALSEGADAGKDQGTNPSPQPVPPSKGNNTSKEFLNNFNELSSRFNSEGPSGTLRFTHFDDRTVFLKQTFARPLVVGYVGFDVKVLPRGILSTPIPSFTVLVGDVNSYDFVSSSSTSFFDDDDGLSDKYNEWLWADKENRNKVIEFLKEKGIYLEPEDIAYTAEKHELLKEVQAKFEF